jgi:adenine-specific DNA-methyltransferase
MITIGSEPNSREIILDFFAGSGATGHGVLKQNAEDGGNRRFILVQLPEQIDPPKTLDDGTTLSTIADITRERVRRAGKKIAADKPNVDTGFRSYKLATSNFTPWDGTPPDAKQGKLDMKLPEKAQQIVRQLEAFTENVIPNRSQEDLLIEIILRLGYDLTVPVEKLSIAGHTVFSIDDGVILACLEASLTLDLFEEMAQRDPGQIVCIDSAFGADDEMKVNAVQIIRSRARSEEATIKLWLV